MIFLTALAGVAFAGEREDVLLKCEAMFGKAVDAKLNLFEISPVFVLKVDFDDSGSVTYFSVDPKYFYWQKHSEWEELDDRPYLSHKEYENLLSRLDEIKSLGAMRHFKCDGVITNSTDYCDGYYENGRLSFGYSDFLDENKDNIRFFSSYFYHNVTAKVLDKKAGKFSFGKLYLVVTENDLNYYVAEETFKKLKRNKRTSFSAVLAPESLSVKNFGELKFLKFKKTKDDYK